MSSMPQLIAVILILGFSGRAADLHLFLLTGLVGALLTISCWAFFPSFGATAFYAVPQDLLTTMPIIVGPEYGAELKRLAAQGVSYISPKDVLGLIGFPSFHTVMSLMSVWFMARFRLAWPVFVVINALMLPAIIVQGGHHLSDVLGGAAAFAVSLTFCTWVLGRLSLRTLPHWMEKTAAA
jgi:membrane-associated phospholipid phosphatase